MTLRFDAVRPLALGCGMALAPAAAAEAACSAGAVGALAVERVTVVAATAVAASATVPAHCDLVGQLRTTGGEAPDGSAGFELRLPADWNKKFLFVGVGGLAGSTYADVSANLVDRESAVAKGYAIAITDSGHLARGTDASWALTAPGQPDEAKLADYYFRATHDVTVAAKEITRRFYGGQDIQQAYFDGCSNGGRQALVEATQFPADYDGIVAGDPFLDIRSVLGAVRLSKQQLSPETYLPATSLPLVDAAITASCDQADGVADGLIQNPGACRFDPYGLVCKPGQADRCLSPGQAQTLHSYFSAVRDAVGGVAYPGWLLLGSGVVTGLSCNQACDEGAEQGFAASACVVHELEEAEVERQLVLRDAPMRAKPGAQ